MLNIQKRSRIVITVIFEQIDNLLSFIMFTFFDSFFSQKIVKITSEQFGIKIWAHFLSNLIVWKIIIDFRIDEIPNMIGNCVSIFRVKLKPFLVNRMIVFKAARSNHKFEAFTNLTPSQYETSRTFKLGILQLRSGFRSFGFGSPETDCFDRVCVWDLSPWTQ